jgi:hypothetical protein
VGPEIFRTRAPNRRLGPIMRVFDLTDGRHAPIPHLSHLIKMGDMHYRGAFGI